MPHPHVIRLAEQNMTRHAIAELAATRTARRGRASPALPETAGRIAARLREHFDPATLPVQQVLGLAEEAGDVTAAFLGIDLDAAWQTKARRIFTRGWRQPPPAA